MQKEREITRGVAHAWYCDNFGHMNVRWYSHIFDDGAYHVWPAFWGSHQLMQEKFGVHTVTASAKINFIKELISGDLVIVDCVVTRVGSKSVTFMERMAHVDTKEIHATYEMTEVFFDPNTRKSAPIPDEIKDALTPLVVSDD